MIWYCQLDVGNPDRKGDPRLFVIDCPEDDIDEAVRRARTIINVLSIKVNGR